MTKTITSLALVAAFLFCAVQVGAQTPTKGVPDKAYMQQILDAWSTLDPAKASVFYSRSPENVYFDIAPLKYNGWSEYEAGVKKLFATFSALKLTLNDDVRVHHKGNDAWATATFRVDETHKDGTKQSSDGRWTIVWQKQGGQWLIVHEQVSLPAPAPAAVAEKSE
ncbi:MAG: nuclear transport factor 2 family protein [Acidobacteriales bacterium]|nr:nuclear transport factor 2 family protein [Terriglobales bacterium]